ncbi:uncharacterized protein LOC117111027 isoform X2 [Anneissia japonica]|uniref:uncharacterized protein LOC117111027 isoform X2 n=1 Tax=Anneissia japonica TaxID=1529436 RepID=UPI001425AF4D|nr:uncharacterized protein LOC117111027 isoform X2 [Anneissia japonica]
MSVVSYLPKNWCILLGSTVIIFGSASCMLYVRYVLRKLKRSRKIEDRIENEISINDLYILTSSPNASLRRSAEQLLLDRITQRPKFAYVLQECYSSDSERAHKGCTVLCVILKSNTMCEKLLKKNTLQVIPVMARRQTGDIILQKLCLQMLVVLINTLQRETRHGLQQIARCGILIPAVACLKSDDAELVYWAAALIHEFSVADVLRNEICQIPFLIESLQKALQTGGEAPLQRLILRVICFLALHNDHFKLSLINQKGLIERIPVCLASGEKEVIHWSLVLVHDIAMIGKKALENLLNFTNDKIIESIMSVIRMDDSVLLRLLAETFGFFCSCETLHLRVVKAGALAGILKLSEMHDPDLVFWSAALLLNLAMTSDEVKVLILQAGGLHTLMELALGDYDNSQVTTMAAKTLAMMGYVEGALRVKVHCNMDTARVSIIDKEYNLDSPGISVMMWDTLHSSESIYQSFNSKSDEAIPIKIPCLEEAGPNAIGNLVFLIIRGEYGRKLLRDLKETLKFSDHTSVTGTLTSDLLTLPASHVCIIVSVLDDDKKLDVWHISKNTQATDLQLQFPYASIVKNRVVRLVLEPEIKLLLSVSLTSPISRVSSLELLEILARPDSHSVILLQYQDLVQHLTTPIWYCSKKGLDESQGEPVLVAHCVGALKLLLVLTVHDQYRKSILLQDTVNAVTSLLYDLVSIWLTSTLEGSLPINRPFSRAGRESNVVSSLYFSEARHDSLADSISVDSIQDTISTISSIIQTYRPVAMIGEADPDQQARAAQVEYDNGNSRMSELPGGFPRSQHADIYTSLTQHSIQFLVNLAAIQDQDLFKVVQMMLIKTGTAHLLWALLLLSQDNLKNSISLAISSTLSLLSAVDLSSSANNTVRLDLTTKTPALIFSANALEVRNDSWTFESILANVAVPSQGLILPNGWYFEVELRSSGIVQIGFATKHSALEPEKGIGIGDDTESYAFDGARCKLWSGPITELMSNDYGMQWQEGDIISCLIDKHGNISYWLRGLNMGVAFVDIDLKRCFYPACSLSTNQEIAFNFGDRPFRYANIMPVGYVAYREIISTPVSFSSRYHDVPGVSWWIPFEDLDDKDAFDEEEEDIILTEDLEDETLIGEVNGCGEEMAIWTDQDEEILIKDSMTEMGGGDKQGAIPFKNDGGEILSKVDSETTSSPGEVDQELARDSPTLAASNETSLNCPDHVTINPENEKHPKECFDNNDIDTNQPIRDVQSSLAGDEYPDPSLYFEVLVTADSPNSVIVGYTSIDGMDQVCVIYSTDGTLQLPDDSTIQCKVNGNTTLGCGLLLPPGSIFFTINGHPIKRLFSFVNEEVGTSPLVPITNTTLLDFNFGNRLFLYSSPNHLEQRISMAAILHDFQQNRTVETRGYTEQAGKD